MGLISSLFSGRFRAESLRNPSPGLISALGAGVTRSGSSVSQLSAMQLSIVWACIKILAEDISSLPIFLYKRRKDGGKDKATDDPRNYLLHDAPNPEMSAMSFRESYAYHLLAWGNAYAEQQKTRTGKTVALWLIAPNRVQPFRDLEKNIAYQVTITGDNLQRPAETINLPKSQILHTPALGFNGIIGYSPIAWAREAIGMGMSLEEFGQNYFSNGIHPSVVVSHPSVLKEPKHLRESLQETYGGLGKTHRLLLLEEGMKVEKLGIPNDEAQFLETRRYQNIEIGTRIYRVPPYMYGEMDKTAFANVEQQSLDYVGKTLRPWLVRLEQAYNINLLSPAEQGTYFFKHDVDGPDGLLRGALNERYSAYSIGRQWGWLSADDVREMENKNPLPDGQGKAYLTPLNMVPAGEKADETNDDKGEK